MRERMGCGLPRLRTPHTPDFHRFLGMQLPNQVRSTRHNRGAALHMRAGAGRAIQLPGKAISAVLQRIAKDLPPEHLAAVQQFHAQVSPFQ